MPTTELAKIVQGQILDPEGAYEIGKISLRKDLDYLVERSHGVIINDSDDHLNAIDLGRTLTSAGNAIDDHYKPFKQELDKIKKIILNDEKFDRERTDVAKKLI